MGNTEFTEKAKELVREYTADHLDKADETPAFEVFVVCNAYILGNMKALLCRLKCEKKARRETGGRRARYCAFYE